ncbi:centromeric histone H3 [Pseudogymnoascus destructans]|uniref:Uncharacterized protein n=2 Tax=Pseudogymnoascus destructans TaxID=655981 RepID=L8FZN4_PSED2|nr:centromeric histone H3 [Pseudogymnoascus destructans]ELR06327.1 hypothetical protein GMDG_07918 [Pseudogymnoascus destructans 20631-21]OAF57753.1 centromeric histone H3 [Pseudogymnoascus destructans]
MEDNSSEFNLGTDSTGSSSSSSSPQCLHTPDPSPICRGHNLQEHQPLLNRRHQFAKARDFSSKPPNTQPEKRKKKKGPIPSFFPSQKFGPKEAPKMPSAQKAPQKAPTNTAANAPLKPKCRWKPGVVALRQIKRYQKSTEPLIPRAPFIQLIREIMVDLKVDF